MKFVLDEDVMASVARVFTSKGHQAWTVPAAGLSGLRDDDVTIYAGAKGACLLSHDVEFGAKRRRNPIGWHVQLGCKEVQAAELIALHLDSLVDVLSTFPDLYVYLSKDGMSMHRKWS